MYWKEASKFLMSKHQQVQLLEAAAILVGMDSNARSLPEEKALWPAAVSPPSSGLLGCDQVNFDKLMASKTRNASAALSDAPTVPFGTSAPTHSTPMMVRIRPSYSHRRNPPPVRTGPRKRRTGRRLSMMTWTTTKWALETTRRRWSFMPGRTATA